MIKICGICKTPLNQPNKPETGDCGGDCVKCMAEAGDPDCKRLMLICGFNELFAKHPSARIVANSGQSMFSGYCDLVDIEYHAPDAQDPQGMIELIFE